MVAMPRVLQVEDYNLSASLLELLLNEVPGFRVVSVPTWKKALESLKAEPFDAVLLDLTLPDSEPPETAAQIRTSLAHLPVVVITGLDDSSEASRAARAAADGYLAKGGVDKEEIAGQILQAIERHRARHRAPG